MKIEIKNRFTGAVIYSYECENNTISKTVQEAVKNKINLSSSDLRNSDLSGSDLRNSDLRNSDLRNSDLSGSNLINSNLSGSNLRNSDLRNAKMPIYSKWNVSIIDNSIIIIGCKEKTIQEWVEWFENSNEEFETKRDSDDFKRIRASFYAHKAYIENL